MEIVLKIVGLKANQNDFGFWLSKSDTERLERIEILRQQYINLKKDVQPIFQRVNRIVNPKQG